MSKSSSGCLSIVLFFALCISLVANIALIALMGAKSTFSGKTTLEPKFEEEILVNGNSSDKIAVITLHGIISYSEPGSQGQSMVQDLKFAFDQAGKDKKVKAVILLVDSPGGEVTAGDEIYHNLCILREKKPVVVYMTSLGASAAYYISCGSSWIMANESTFTGSIGVIISTLNYENLFGKIGLQSVIFKSGAFKDMLNGARPMTEAEKVYVQSLVMQTYDRFLSIVAKSRKLDKQKLRNGIADGRVLSGLDAYQEKLIDQLGYVEDAYAKAKELSKSPDAEVVQYVPRYGLASFLKMFSKASTPKLELDILPGSVVHLEPGRVYLLPSFYAH
ncbi:MAG: signal peptide peptidase SppA [Chthoniobacterales bacterium]